MYLAKNIKYLRQKKGLSLRQLGLTCMIDPTHLSRIENYENQAKSTSIYKLAELATYFEISIDALVYTDLSKEHMSPSDIKDNELEFWGIQYFYELYGQLCNHEPEAVKQKLEERFNAKQLEQFYKWQKNKFKIWIDID